MNEKTYHNTKTKKGVEDDSKLNWIQSAFIMRNGQLFWPTPLKSTHYNGLQEHVFSQVINKMILKV
jgi:hypothetical protein